jgi:hypothetical protein
MSKKGIVISPEKNSESNTAEGVPVQRVLHTKSGMKWFALNSIAFMHFAPELLTRSCTGV